MIALTTVKDYTELLVADIAGLKEFRQAVDIEHVISDLKNVNTTDGDMLYLMVPEFQDDLENSDAIEEMIIIDWFVLRKFNSKAGESAKIEAMYSTHDIAMKIREHIFTYARGDGAASCGGFLRYIFPSGGLTRTPVHHHADLFGWHLKLTVKSYG